MNYTMQCRIFSFSPSEQYNMQRSISEWLLKENVNVFHVLQSSGLRDAYGGIVTTITIFYTQS